MKLYELIDFQPKASKQSNTSYTDNLKMKGGAKQIGSTNNAFGKAFQGDSPKRLNQVTKTAKAGSFKTGPASTPEDDGYLSYLQRVYQLEQKGYENPYFPRIHKLKVMKDGKGEIHYKVDMEKLLPFKTPKLLQNEDLMKGVWDHMFVDEFDQEDYKKNRLSDEMSVMFSKILNGNRNGLVKDPQLKDALGVIKKVKQEKDFGDDLHGDNFMWRITGTMPQIVLVDPLS